MGTRYGTPIEPRQQRNGNHTPGGQGPVHQRRLNRLFAFFFILSSLSGPTLPASADASTSAFAGATDQAFGWGHNACPSWVGLPVCYQAVLDEVLVAPSPSLLAGFDDVIALAAGDVDSTVVRADGTVWSWGLDALSGVVSEPRQIPAISDVMDIGVGGNLSVALRSDGTVWAWGGPFPGDGSSGYVSTPVQVLLPGPASSIGASSVSGHAVLADGTVWSWGLNGAGTVGDGTYLDRPSPVPALGLSSVVAIDAGSSHVLALGGDGTVWGWGQNHSGMLGLGSDFTDRTTPTQIPNLDGVVDVGAGAFHSAAVRIDGSVMVWGRNFDGTLGIPGPDIVPEPTPLPGFDEANEVDAGVNYTLALRRDGSLWGWGVNEWGSLGIGVTSSVEMVPVPVGLGGVTTFSAGHLHVLAIAENRLPIGYHDISTGDVAGPDCVAAGWAVDPDDVSARLTVRISSDGSILGETTAHLFRQDLIDAGVSPDGLAGFVFDLRGHISVGEPHTILVEAQDAQTAAWQSLADTPKVLTCADSPPEGTHDGVSGNQPPWTCVANGWAVDPDDRTARLTVRILVDGHEVTSAVADMFRQDLIDAGVSPDGLAGFNINLWGLISHKKSHEIRAQAQDNETGEWFDLDSTPKTLRCFVPPPSSGIGFTGLWTATDLDGSTLKMQIGPGDTPQVTYQDSSSTLCDNSPSPRWVGTGKGEYFEIWLFATFNKPGCEPLTLQFYWDEGSDTLWEDEDGDGLGVTWSRMPGQ